MEAKREAKEEGRRIQQIAGKIWGWESAAGKFRVQRRAGMFLRHIDRSGHHKILEIGCGTGIFTEVLCQAGLAPVSVDISYDLLRRAKSINPRAILVQADAENLPFKNGAFDYCLGVSILHHLALSPALRAIKAVLRDNGTILFSEPNMANPQIFLQRKIKWLRKNFYVTSTETAFFKRQLKNILEREGFREVAVYPFEFLHPSTPAFAVRFIKRVERLLERAPCVREIAGSLFISGKNENADIRR